MNHSLLKIYRCGTVFLVMGIALKTSASDTFDIACILTIALFSISAILFMTEDK